MSAPLSSWTCDVCGDTIHKVEDGYLIWKNGDDMRAHGFKIIHRGQCDQKDHACSGALADFTGPAGLSVLLSHLSMGPLAAARGASHCDVGNLDEFVDLVRRLHVPYYEQARQRFADPDVRDAMRDANEIQPYLPDTLARLSGEA